MKKIALKSSILAIGIIGFTGASAQAQPGPRPYEQQSDRREERRSQRRELLALQDDLRLVDDGLAAMQPRSRRYAEFQDRAEGIRAEVTELVNDVNRRGGPDRPGDGQVQIAALRLKIATLRNDIEDVQNRRARPASYRLPAGTEMEVALNQSVSSRLSNPGDRIQAETLVAIRLNGRTVIPAGATLSGTIREVRSRDRGQQDGFVQMDFDTITPERGAAMPIRARVVSISENHETGHDHQLRNGGLGALLGGVLGAVIDGKKGALIGAAVGAGGGVLASKGDDVELPEGTVVTIRLDNPIVMRAGR